MITMEVRNISRDERKKVEAFETKCERFLRQPVRMVGSTHTEYKSLSNEGNILEAEIKQLKSSVSTKRAKDGKDELLNRVNTCLHNIEQVYINMGSDNPKATVKWIGKAEQDNYLKKLKQ